MTDHLITPPPELVKEWQISLDCPDEINAKANYIATQSACWGADTELEACCEWVQAFADEWGDLLRQDRRPQPSLKEQALEAARIELLPTGKNAALIIRALEALPDD